MKLHKFDWLLMAFVLVCILWALASWTKSVQAGDCYVGRLNAVGHYGHGRAAASAVFVDQYGRLIDRYGRGVVFHAAQVGQSLRNGAVIENELRKRLIELLAVDRGRPFDDRLPLESKPSRLTAQTSTLNQKCGVCHKPGHETGVVLDGSVGVSDLHFRASMTEMAAGRMPKPESSIRLVGDDQASILAELLTLTPDHEPKTD